MSRAGGGGGCRGGRRGGREEKGKADNYERLMGGGVKVVICNMNQWR